MGADEHGLGGREWCDGVHAAEYRQRAPGLPHWGESEDALVEQLPERVGRVLDLGTGDGRLLALVLRARPGAVGVGLDFSPPMLAAARARFDGNADVTLVEHDLALPLPELGRFDAIVSGYAIHHLEDARKRAIYAEVHERLEPGGRFLNLEHVASPTAALHAEFMAAVHEERDDPSNRLVPAEAQVGWLRDIGFTDADCYWKWRELALIGGRRR